MNHTVVHTVSPYILFKKYKKFEFLTLNKYFRGAPGNAKETIAILDKRENYQYHCPYDLDASHWTFDPSGAYSGSFFKQDSNCNKLPPVNTELLSKTCLI